MKHLEISDLSYTYGDTPGIENISLYVNKGEFVGLIGPNGSGKSTILKNIYRSLSPTKGSIILGGKDLLKMSRRESALKMAVVCQENDIPFDFTVEEITAMGRSPHKRLFENDNDYDKKIVHDALAQLGISDMSKRSYTNLSGGEKQRVIIARAIAQESDFLVLDEPTNHLDIGYQMQIFDFVDKLNVTVIAAVHDLNIASLYCDRLYVVKNGRIVLQGIPQEVLTTENIKSIYGVDCIVENNAITKRPYIVYLPARTIKENI